YEAGPEGENLESIGTLGEFLDIFLNIPKKIEDIVLGELIERFEKVEQALAWFHDAGEKLVKCSKNKSVFLRICKFSYDEFNFESLGFHFVFPNPWGMWPVVEECYQISSNADCVHTVEVPPKPSE
ncbi:MAG TPA: hypothetical protein VFR48_04105, partial [Solirubrobacteraceae bacterium]|nr:hypothetical protein [Solirubrobacteraceae bacterium]